jgi:hypothetical protein
VITFAPEATVKTYKTSFRGSRDAARLNLREVGLLKPTQCREETCHFSNFLCNSIICQTSHVIQPISEHGPCHAAHVCHPTHVGAAGLALSSAIRFHTTQDALVRGGTYDNVPMEPTTYGRVATAMTTAVSAWPRAPDGDDGDSEPIWSLELDLSWARLDATCGSHTLAESEPLIPTGLAVLPSTVARAGCVAYTRSINEHITRPLNCLPSFVPLSAFATNILPKLQADKCEYVNLLRFAKIAPTFSDRARAESRRIAPRLDHDALAFLASNTPTTGRLSELVRDEFLKRYDAVFRVAV